MTNVTLGAAFTKLNCEAQILDGDLTNLEEKAKQLLNVSTRLGTDSQTLKYNIETQSPDHIKTNIDHVTEDAIDAITVIGELLKMIRNTQQMTKEHIETFNRLKSSL